MRNWVNEQFENKFGRNENWGEILKTKANE